MTVVYGPNVYSELVGQSSGLHSDLCGTQLESVPHGLKDSEIPGYKTWIGFFFS